MSRTKFIINDSVTIVNYGKIKHIPKNQVKVRPECVVCEGSVFYCVDIMPHLVGLSGTVKDCHTDSNTNLTTYTVDVDECLLVLEEEQLDKSIIPVHKCSVIKLLDPEVREIVITFVREMVTEMSIQQVSELYEMFVQRKV